MDYRDQMSNGLELLDIARRKAAGVTLGDTARFLGGWCRRPRICSGT